MTRDPFTDPKVGDQFLAVHESKTGSAPRTSKATITVTSVHADGALFGDDGVPWATVTMVWDDGTTSGFTHPAELPLPAHWRYLTPEMGETIE